jgi:hypothetical protein
MVRLGRERIRNGTGDGVWGAFWSKESRHSYFMPSEMLISSSKGCFDSRLSHTLRRAFGGDALIEALDCMTDLEHQEGTGPDSPSRRPYGAFLTGSAAWSAVAVLLVAAGCSPQAPAPLPPPMVQVIEVGLTNVPLFTEIIGQLDSPQNVEIRARVEAFVEGILFTEGTEVAEGDSLFALDRRPFEQRLAAAQGMLAEATATLNKYEKDVARLTPLAKAQAIPQQDLDNAVASVEVGKASVLSAQARVESAQIDLNYTDVRAPISGTDRSQGGVDRRIGGQR